MDGGFFPQVDILKDGSSYTVFGTEANSYNNQLDTDIFQIQDNFTMNYGRHQITVGTQSDYRTFKNGLRAELSGLVGLLVDRRLQVQRAGREGLHGFARQYERIRYSHV